MSSGNSIQRKFFGVYNLTSTETPVDDNGYSSIEYSQVEIIELSKKFSKYQIIPRENEIINLNENVGFLHFINPKGEKELFITAGKLKVIEVHYTFDQEKKYDSVSVVITDPRLGEVDVNEWKSI